MAREVFVFDVAAAAKRIQAEQRKTEAGAMAKKVFRGGPGESGVGDAVRAWLDRVGIDPGMVIGYSVFQHVGEVPRIMLEMYFDDGPPQADVTGLDKVEREYVSRETLSDGEFEDPRD